MTSHDIPYYLDYLSAPLLDRLERDGQPVEAVPGLTVAKGLRDDFDHLETDEALAFACELYRRTRDDLREVLDKRARDRAFIDRTVEELNAKNADRDYLSPDYETIIGRTDEEGRVLVGPLPEDDRTDIDKLEPVEISEPMQGMHVTLFGPADTPKMSINAMNALHRKAPNEPDIITELVEESGAVPKWGADNEDSKTPIMHAFLKACDNLVGCFDGTLRFEDEERDKVYELADEKLAKPIKRIPGLALPDGSHLLDGNPLPLHLYDFAMHLFHNWEHPEALTFYIPKLENEEEAAYLKALIAEAESMLKERHPAYEKGTVKVILVFENPRAIFRIREMAEALAPHFIGGSLGWHDFLASTARLFKNDPNYRIPVKADPNIVVNHIKESHEILARALEPMGAIKIGGMYGVLFEAGNDASLQVSMVGYIKDVIAQLKRGLDGFWVAHPDFVRVGIALVEAYRRHEDDPEDDALERLVAALVSDPDEREPLLDFVFDDDVPGLPEDDPLYRRGV
ncbi:MAG: hypothetical protein ACOCV2_11035, partial [Persicimonas sp.]